MDTKKTVVTPGGRIGSDASTGSRSNGENWVERTRAGRLPRYIRIVRNGLMREGHPEGRATALAVAAMKRWAAGGDNVSPKVQAAAAKAVAEWEAMKAEKWFGDLMDELEAKGWSEDAHPRVPKGKTGGGRFAPKDKNSDSDKDSDKDDDDLPEGKLPRSADKYDDPKSIADVRELMQRWSDVPLSARAELKKRLQKWMKENSKGEHERLATLVDGLGDGDGKREAGEGAGAQHTRESRTDWAEDHGWEAPKKKKWDEVSDAEFKAEFSDTLLSELHEHIDNTTEMKDADMKLETKQAVGVSGLEVVDEEKGIVEAFVSVTGIRDNVKDVIHPGAYEKTLATRIPKGVYAHDWKMPVSKALEVKELLPGSPELPDNLKALGAGALKVKMQFNLDTERGRDAYSDVIFYKDQQEWSIGYQVPQGGARLDTKTGIRHIDYLELYEFSPVLFGAMSHARTANVKSLVEMKDFFAHEDIESMSIIRFKELCDGLGVELKTESPEGEAGTTGAAAEDNGDTGSAAADPAGDEGEADGALFDDEEDEAEGKAFPEFSAYEYDWLVKTRYAIDSVLDAADERLAAEAKSGGAEAEEETKGLSDIIESSKDALGNYAEELKDAAEAFDTAYDLDDVDGMNDFGNDVLEVIEKALEDEGLEPATERILRKVAAGVASMAPDTDEDEEEADEAEETTGKKPLPPRNGSKDDHITVETKELPEFLRVALLAQQQK